MLVCVCAAAHCQVHGMQCNHNRRSTDTHTHTTKQAQQQTPEPSFCRHANGQSCPPYTENVALPFESAKKAVFSNPALRRPLTPEASLGMVSEWFPAKLHYHESPSGQMS